MELYPAKGQKSSLKAEVSYNITEGPQAGHSDIIIAYGSTIEGLKARIIALLLQKEVEPTGLRIFSKRTLLVHNGLQTLPKEMWEECEEERARTILDETLDSLITKHLTPKQENEANMPYIKETKRTAYQPVIAELLKTLEADEFNPGCLNYVISKVVWTILEKNKSYRTANELMGVLECVKQELYRRQIGPYEDTKIKESGDI